MSLDVQIKVDATQALPTAQKVEDALHRVERAGEQAGGKTGRSMRGAAADMSKTDKAADTLERSMKKLGAAIGVSFGFREAINLSDTYTGLTNRLRQVATSQDNLNDLLEKVGDIANSTRSDIAATGESFVRLVQATKDLGVSQERALKITASLNMALQSSGASASEAAAGTLQLMQAIASGRLAGDELRSLMENLPQLSSMIAKEMGVSLGMLKQLGAEGKISADHILAALEKNQGAIKKTFDESGMTFSQAATVVKNKAVELVGSGLSIQRAWKDWRGATQDLRLAELDLQNQLGRSSKWMGQLTTQAGFLTAAQYAGIKAAIEHTETGYKMSIMVKEQIEHMRNLADTVRRLASIDPWGDNRSGLQRLFGGLRDKAKGAFGAIKQHIDDVTEASKKARAELERLAEPFARMQRAPVRAALGSELGGQDAYQRYVEAEMARLSNMAAEPDLEADLRAHMGGRNPWERGQRPNYLTDMWSRELDEATRRTEQFRDDMRDLFIDVGESFAQALFDGRMEWDRMLKSMALAMTKVVAMHALGSNGIDTSILRGIRIPGFATGGSFTVGGSGGTDTTPVAFMATPGERVTVETPGQQRDDDGGGGGGGAPISIAIHLDERDTLRALETPDGQRVLARVIRRINPALRSPLSGS